MGELLSISGDREAAIAKVRQYRNLKIDPLVPDTAPIPRETGNPFKVSQA